MYSAASSPGPAYDRDLTPKKGGFLDSLKRALPSGRAESPTSSLGGSDLGTPKSRMFPSFTSGQRKRDIIKKLEEDLSLANLQVHQQEVDIGKLQQQVQQEETSRIDAQERLNMQYFKANLLADMLVMKILDIEQQQNGQQPSLQSLQAPPAPPQAVQTQAVQQPVPQKAVAFGATAVLEESSFE